MKFRAPTGYLAPAAWLMGSEQPMLFGAPTGNSERAATLSARHALGAPAWLGGAQAAPERL